MIRSTYGSVGNSDLGMDIILHKILGKLINLLILFLRKVKRGNAFITQEKQEHICNAMLQIYSQYTFKLEMLRE